MKVKLLTAEQKDSLMGIYFKEHQLFSPIEDANGNWCLGLETVDQTTNPDFEWVKALPEIEYEMKKPVDLKELLSQMGINNNN
jgi:hypothetical protein